MNKTTLIINYMNKSIFYLLISLTIFFINTLNVFGYNLKAIKATNNDIITAINQDSSNFIWIGGSNGLLRFDGYTSIQINDNLKEEHFGYINNIYRSNTENSFFLATNEGLFCYNYVTNEAQIVDEKLRGYEIKSIYFSTDKQWYISTNHGIFIFDSEFQYIDFITPQKGLTNELVNMVIEDKDHNILIAHGGGIDRITKDKKGKYTVSSILEEGVVRFIILDRNDNIWYNVNGKIYWASRSQWLNDPTKAANKISDNTECVLAMNLKDEIWVGTRGNGVLRYGIKKGETPHILEPILIDKSPNAEINNSILSLYQDNNRDIWIGTINGLYLYTDSDNSFNIVKHDANNSNSLSINLISSMYIDTAQTIWLGTSYGINSFVWDKDKTNYKITHYIDYSDSNDVIGSNRILMIAPCSDSLFLISTKLDLKYFDPITKKYFQTDNLDEAYTKYGKRYVRSYYTNKAGNIYMAFNKGGIGVWLKSKKAFYPIRWEGRESGVCRAILQDKSGKLWVGVDGEGLYCLTLSEDGLSVKYETSYNRSQFDNQYVTNLLIDSKQTIWAGTFNGLFAMHINQNEFSPFTLSGIDTHLYVSSINEDKNQNIWISSINGIYKIASKDNINYYEIDNTADISKLWYIIGHDMDKDGMLYIGGTNGLIYFNPSSISFDRRSIRPYISKLTIGNKTDFINNQKFNYGNEPVELLHDHKQISFEFSSLYYPNPHVIRYAYKLEGFDEDWIYTDSYHRFISYSNLSSGQYTLKIKTSNPSGGWSEETGSFTFVVKSSPFMSWYAILIYLICGSALIFLIIKFFVLKLKIKRDNSLNYWKIQNIINITNGLRTPLTLLHAPLEYFVNHYGEIPDEEVKSLLKIMKKNVKNMSDQIDSFMELSRCESENTVLKLKNIDITMLTSTIFNSLKNRAEIKNLSYEMNIGVKDVKVFADPAKIEVIIFNLLSNSIKMTPENGNIILSCCLDAKKHNYKIEINDTSIFHENAKNIITIGSISPHNVNRDINKQMLKSEFFHLSVANDFTQLHKGKLSVTCNENGGTNYTWSIPLGVSHYSAEQLNTLEETEDNATYTYFQKDVKRSEIRQDMNTVQYPDTLSDLPIVIGIDWNADLLSLVKIQLASEYTFINYPFHKNIIDTIKKQKCVAVIIDVSNKEAVSLRLIGMLKKDSTLANIPVVIISACIEDDFEHYCYDLGADLWLKKPFDLKYFHTRISNIIKSREKITEIIKQKLIVNPKEINILSSDEIFLANIMETIERNISNEDFTVDTLAAELNVSHSALYRKLTQLTQQSPVDFIRSIRLKRAAQLLRTHNYLVLEVCSMVGFSDQRYFSTCFKRQYGISPKAYSLKKSDENEEE
ncbi:helix-turn-helix domain-containing protein [Bacteroides sp.]